MDLSPKRISIADIPHDAIVSFEGEYRFLSNFAPSPVTVYGISFPTVEHAFAAAKLDPNGSIHPSQDIFEEMERIKNCTHPGAAKRRGRAKTLNGKPFMRPDWDNAKEDLILRLLFRKFLIPEMKRKLLATNNRLLIEGNTHGDKIWGMVAKNNILHGQNMLGEMLMHIRQEIRSGNNPEANSKS